MSWSEADTASSVPRRFAEQVRRSGDRPAIAGASRQLSYAQLDALANRCAAELLDRIPAARAGDRVALLLSHDATVLAAALATLSCGMAVVTLNPSDPPARLSQIRARAEPRALITDAQHLDHARAAGFPAAETIVDPWQTAAGDERPAGASPDDLAVLICTSGSTGEPKLVMHSHRNLLHNVMRYTNGLAICEDDRVAWLASASGGQGLATALTALLNGAVLCPFALMDRGVTGLAAWLLDQRISVFDTIPSVLRNFARTLHGERIAGVRLVRIASEGALRSDFEAFERHFGAGAALASVLASSEAGIIAQAIYHAGEDPPAGRLPVGRPVAGADVLVLDDDGGQAPAGESGEIVVQGRHLALGYWRDPLLTAERFAVVDGVRRLRTGDLARRTAGGVITVVGRADMQVKVRGNRLQLEEVEAALAAQPQVGGAAVLAAATASGDARLTAYVLAKDGPRPQAAQLRRALGVVLAPYAIPSAFVFVESFPLTPHGKIDRRRLAEVAPAPPPARSVGLVASETEELVAGMWCEAFERDEIGPDEAFLELGGDSLLAAQVAAGIHDLFGIDIGLDAFASDPTVATLTALVDERRRTSDRAAAVPLRKLVRTGPLSSAQARMWSAGAGGSDARWQVVVPFRVDGELDVDVLRASVQCLVARHEILRTTFTDCEDRPLAVVRPSMAVELAAEDLRGAVDPLSRAEEILASEALRPFDLERGPLLRLRLLRVGDAEHRLLRVSHHIIHDALSWRIFFDELGRIYDALLDGRPSPLADAPQLQYLDYAVWERASVRRGSPSREAEVDWWQRTLSPPPPPLRLPFARPERVPAAEQDAGAISWGLPAASSDALDRIARAAGGTYFMTRLAAFAALLALDGGVDDLVIGTPVSTRSRTELQRMFGPFLNFGVLRLRLAGDASFRGWLAEVRRTVVDVGSHVSVPWEQLSAQLRERGVAIPMVWARFVAWPVIAPMTLGGVTVEALPRRCTELWGFRLGVNQPYESDRCWAEFDPCLHDPAAVRRFLNRLTAFVAAICAAPDRPLSELHAAMPGQ